MEFEAKPVIIDEEVLDYIALCAIYERDVHNIDEYILFALYDWFENRSPYGDINILTKKGLKNLIDEIEKRIKEKENVL